MNYEFFLNKLKEFIPDNSFDYYKSILDKNEFSFYIKRPRQRKLGDFKVDLRTNALTITLNNNLHPYQFHLTFLHELAHLKTYVIYGNKVKPHGQEWKNEFKKLIAESIEKQIFTGEIKQIVEKCYIKKNNFSSNCKDFENYIRKQSKDFYITVKDIPINTVFVLKNYKQFKKLEKRRTRFICEEINSGNKYLVSQDAEILNFNPI